MYRSMDDATRKQYQVDNSSLNERILPNKNVGEVVNPGVASKASEFEFAQNAHKTTNKAELAQYCHQSLLLPPVVTITNVIEKDQLNLFPGLEKALLKHLPVSSATIKGHCKKTESVYV